MTVASMSLSNKRSGESAGELSATIQCSTVLEFKRFANAMFHRISVALLNETVQILSSIDVPTP
jgi:hypothetical protein